MNEGKKEVFSEAKGEGFDVKVLREILRLRKQDKNERDEQESLLDLYLRAGRTPARRKQRQHSATPATNFPCCKRLVSQRFSPPSINSTIRKARKAKPLVEFRPATSSRDIPHRNRDRFFLADPNHQALAAGDAGVETSSCDSVVFGG